MEAEVVPAGRLHLGPAAAVVALLEEVPGLLGLAAVGARAARGHGARGGARLAAAVASAAARLPGGAEDGRGRRRIEPRRAAAARRGRRDGASEEVRGRGAERCGILWNSI